MSDISEVLSALKRGNLSIEEILSELTSSLNTSKKSIEELNNPIQDLIEFERKQNEEISKFESGNLALSQEVTNLKEEKATNERLLKESQDSYSETTEKRSKIETKIRETNTVLSDIEQKLASAKSSLASEAETNERLVAEISTVVESAEQKTHAIEKQAEIERDLIRKSKGERMALEYLIKRNHIEFNELKVINSLEGRSKTDMATISKVTGLASSLIEKTLEGLMKRNVLTYDSSTGAINVTGNLKL